MGVADTLQWVTKFGFDPARQPNNLTLSLGTGSVTPLQLASGYAVLANGGYTITPRVIERITDAQGQMLYEAPPAPVLAPEARVIPERNTFVMRTLLQEVTRTGTAARAQAALKRPDLYGKTGTTSDAVDAWFAGFQPSVVAVVWIGYDTPRSLGSRESGGGLALPVWIQYMDKALRGVPVQALASTDGVVEVDGNWRYAEWAERGMVDRLGLGDEPDGLTIPAGSAASAVATPEASGAAGTSATLPVPAASPSTESPAASSP
jgi:penicillin-binding protein 1A